MITESRNETGEKYSTEKACNRDEFCSPESYFKLGVNSTFWDGSPPTWCITPKSHIVCAVPIRIQLGYI